MREPRHEIVDNTPSTPPSSSATRGINNSTPPANKKPADYTPSNKDLPYGSPVAGRPNMVNSPYAQKSQLVDVAGMSAGQTVKCPYSGKLFKVPASQQSSATATNRVAPKTEAPKTTPKPAPTPTPSAPKIEAPKITPPPAPTAPSPSPSTATPAPKS
ncbi:MAG: hypothetical protein IPK32_03040 [Verrucomicrobiaceae bacterium]|nr:hypothetical protein [Verrucomicrobiaceae bacterium]